MDLILIVLVGGACLLSVAGFIFTYVMHQKQQQALGVHAKRLETQVSELGEELRASQAQVRKLASQLKDAEEQLTTVGGVPATSISNINRRTQIVRMLRAGQPSARIAAELKVSRGEIDLIEKVQSIVSLSYESGESEKMFEEGSRFSANA